MSIEGKSVLVTGSNSGIGIAIVEACAQQGANVFLNSFTNNSNDHELAKSLEEKFNISARYICADLSQQAEARKLVASCESVDILVNNAGIQHISPIEFFPSAMWDKIIAINLSAAFHTIAMALPSMKKSDWGRIINISSAHGLTASPYKSAYIAAKHGLVGLTKTVALETAEQPITCNAICPGFVKTPLLEAQIPDQMVVHKKNRDEVIRDVILERQPSKQFVTTGQIAQTVIFLCSAAADQITGTTISIDGGWTAL